MTAFDQAGMEAGSTADPSLLFAMTALVLLLAALCLYQLWWPLLRERLSWRKERARRQEVLNRYHDWVDQGLAELQRREVQR